jgi:hypothetical protein
MKTQSYLLHAMAGIIIIAIPYVLSGVPANILDMTVGGVLGMVFKLAHDFAGY